jgi:hypothetical protein
MICVKAVVTGRSITGARSLTARMSTGLFFLVLMLKTISIYRSGASNLTFDPLITDPAHYHWTSNQYPEFKVYKL